MDLAGHLLTLHLGQGRFLEKFGAPDEETKCTMMRFQSSNSLLCFRRSRWQDPVTDHSYIARWGNP